MNIDKLREEITYDEGVKYEVYIDNLGLPTFGIGHLVTKNDEEYGEDVGYPVSEQRVNEVFEEDMNIVLNDCQILYDDFDDLPEECQHIIANMMFNMGRPRLSKFKGMKRGLDEREWNSAADEMLDARWYRQAPKRADRLVNRMRALAN